MIVFISNFISEHQIPLCDALFKIEDGNFWFIATEPMWEDRKQLGFVDQSSNYPYILKSYESEERQYKAMKMAIDADVVILGAASYKYIDQRVRNGKLTFKYTERYFKQSRLRVLDPRILKNRWIQDFQYRKMPYYLLCAGAYVAGDAALIKSYPGKMYKWGYFPKTIHYSNINEIIENKYNNSLLWVGRFIDWKHPEVPIDIAKELKKRNIPFQLTMIGTGPMVDVIKEKIESYGLTGSVTLTGALSPEKVRKEMEMNELHIFSSDRNEGWGVVLNESMNAACVPIANKMIGAVPFLVNNRVNGYIYTEANICQLADYIENLFQNPADRKSMAASAYKTIINQWNAENAAARFIELSKNLMHGTKDGFSEGVCSKADVL